MEKSADWLSDTAQYRIYLGRSLNESAYVTNDADAENPYEHGAGYDLRSMPGLRYMAAATALYEDVLGQEEIGELTSLKASLVSDNLLFYPVTGSNYDERITALEVTVWQQDDQDAWRELGTSTVAYQAATAEKPEVAALNVAGMDGYAASRQTLVQVKAVYDTGLYGARQDAYLKAAADLGDEGLQIWSALEDARTYLVRQQEAGYWYFGETTAVNTENNWRLSTPANTVQKGYTWKYTEKIALGDTEGTWNLQRVNVTNGSDEGRGASDISLDNTKVTGTGYLTDDTGYLTAAAGGWTDRETKKALVLGALGTAAPKLTVDPAESGIELSATDVVIDDVKYEAGSLLSFVSPQSSVQFSNIIGYTYAANSFTINLKMPGSSLKKMLESDKEYEFYPYLFLELYEDTETATNTGQYSEEQLDGTTGHYQIAADGTGTPLEDQKYFGREVYGAAAASDINAFDKNVFKDLPALKADLENLNDGWQCSIILRNLQAGKSGTGNTAQNYSLRVYVLPVREDTDSGLQKITYNTADDIAKHKVYVQDQDPGTSTMAKALRYYTAIDMNCWYRVRTRDTNAFTGTPTAEYDPLGYEIKNVDVNYGVKYGMAATSANAKLFRVTYGTGKTASIAENYVEYRIRDGNAVVMTHDEIMQAAGYSPQTAKAEHYNTATGDTVASADSSRKIIIYEKTGSVYRPDSKRGAGGQTGTGKDVHAGGADLLYRCESADTEPGISGPVYRGERAMGQSCKRGEYHHDHACCRSDNEYTVYHRRGK